MIDGGQECSSCRYDARKEKAKGTFSALKKKKKTVTRVMPSAVWQLQKLGYSLNCACNFVHVFAECYVSDVVTFYRR